MAARWRSCQRKIPKVRTVRLKYFNDHSYSYFSRREPKRLLVPRVEKGKSSQSFDDEFVILIYYFFLPSSSFSKVL